LKTEKYDHEIAGVDRGKALR